jgi:RimJ/RimL family protein N-acetyltransferase
VFVRTSDERLKRVELDPIGPGWSGIVPNAIEVGCIVHPLHWNRGIATEATLLGVADCFGRVGLARLVALTRSDNKPSLRALEKLGMERRGETQHEGDLETYELFELTHTAAQR